MQEMRRDLKDMEDELMKSIASTLESHGYMPRIRAQLKVNTLRKAQELESNGSISNNGCISPKQIDDDNDAVMIELCRQLFEYCGMKETAEMLSLEVSNQQNVNITSKFPQLDAKSDVPALLQLISKANK